MSGESAWDALAEWKKADNAARVAKYRVDNLLFNCLKANGLMHGEIVDVDMSVDFAILELKLDNIGTRRWLKVSRASLKEMENDVR